MKLLARKKTKIILSSVTLFSVLLPLTVFANAHLIFQNDDFYQVYADSILINSDNEQTGDFGLTFGQSLGETFNWNATTSRFEISDDLNIQGGLEVAGNIDVNSNQLLEARVENQSSDPTCNGANAGRLDFNTTSNLFKYCNSTSWIAIAPLVIGQFYDAAGGTDVDVTTPVAIPFNQETRKDPGITHSNTTNKSRITLDEAGWYRISYAVTHSNATLTVGNIHCSIRLNGTTTVTPSDTYSVDTTVFTSKATNSGTALFQTTSANEYAEVMCNNNGLAILGSLNTSANESWALIERL